MVCERALGVAAKRSYEYVGDRKRISYVGWDNEPGEVRAEWRESVRQALEPYLQALDGWVLVPKDRYRELVEEELWNAFNCGIERDSKWMDGGRSEGEWLVQKLGLPDDGWHDAEVMKGMMAAAVDSAMLAAGGVNG